MLQWLLCGVRRELGLVEPAYVPDMCRRELRGNVQPRVLGALLPELQVEDFASHAGKSVPSTASLRVPLQHHKNRLRMGCWNFDRHFVRSERGGVPTFWKRSEQRGFYFCTSLQTAASVQLLLNRKIA